MPPKPKRPTQEDVARLAGVSRGTVSLVLNNVQSRVVISRETRERVIAAARELQYSPNPVAQMLARGTNRIIGFFTFEDTFPFSPADFYYPYLLGIQREAGKQDYNVILFTRNQGTLSRRIFTDGMNSLRLADGVVLVGNYPDPAELRRLADEDYPFVLIGRCSLPQDAIDTVVNDHTPASYQATQHLIQLNHRRLGFLVDDLNLEHHQERLTGCQRAVQEAGNVELTILNRHDLQSQAHLLTALRRNKITALICGDRTLSTPALRLIQRLQLHIPEDLSLIFLVSSTWKLPFANPTRVSFNPELVGRVAVQRLVKRITGSIDSYQQLRVPCKFIAGETTAPC